MSRMKQELVGRIRVVYILSSGRSGSTILDLLLGAEPGLWTLGEAQMLPWELSRAGARCGCGTDLGKCSFWRSVTMKVLVNGGQYPLGYFRDAGFRDKVLRWRHLPSVALGKASGRWAGGAGAYGRANAKLFQVVREVAQRHRNGPVRWLVDASKDPYRLLWLKSSGLFDLRVIHLVKDPRAFAYSMLRQGNGVDGSRRKAVRLAGRWLVQNVIFSWLCRVSLRPSHVRRIRYEVLATDPDETLAELSAWLGIPSPSDVTRTFRCVESHGVSGNAARWQEQGIRLDDRWRRLLPHGHARAVWVLTWPLARSYGYTRRGQHPGLTAVPRARA